MTSLILAGALWIIWAITIILMYYSNFYSSVTRVEPTSGYALYLVTIFVLYGGYRLWIWLTGKKSQKFSLVSIIGITLLHIFLIGVFYTTFPEVIQSPFLGRATPSSLTLFFHIVELLIYPLLLILLTRNAGLSFISFFMKSWRSLDMRLRVPGEISIGFFILSILLLLCGIFGVYTLGGLVCTLVVLGAIGAPSFLETYRDIRDRHISLEYDETPFSGVRDLRALSVEFGFFFLTFLLAISLINIIRPMPIGWDDLGVYMNFPKIMASTYEVIKGGGMYAWQLITGTGFLFDFNASQAFYVNQLGGILAVIFLMSVLSYAFEHPGKKSLISLATLLAVFYYAMPMTVFQQAKDMKLDPAYLAFALSALGLLFYGIKSLDTKKDLWKLLLIIGVIVGFTFTIKFTSVMLILGALGYITYRYASFWGYIGFFFLFIAIFTRLGLWGMMNVPMPKDPLTLTGISIVLFIGAIGSFGLSMNSLGKTLFLVRIKEWFIICSVFLIGVLLASTPWFIKNISEYQGQSTNLTFLQGALFGKNENTLYNYEKIYTKEEIATISKSSSEAITKDGKSENEDLGRYFGYETGLNNYLKLPANLTFQVNQGGEFTDITYLFLALVPSMLLFILGRREYTMIVGAGSLLVFMGLYFFASKSGIGASLSEFFSTFTLIYEAGNLRSLGYLVLIGINLGIVALIHFGTKDTETNQKLRDVSVFMGVYAFLFLIAAFGIVWYGILIYFGFFLILGFAGDRFLSYTSDDEKDHDKMGVMITLSVILFVFIGIYFFRSAFAHGWNNLKSAYYNEYKYNILSQEESIFAYRSDYLIPIATMNLRDVRDATDGVTDGLESIQMKEFFAKTNIREIPIDAFHAFLTKYRGTTDPLLKKDIARMGDRFYKNILYPSEEKRNPGNIYRVGTFMTYLINRNNIRFFEDSLVMIFRDYFYDQSPEVTIERMKKMDLKYLLVDLNAATIDRDPRRNLTTRFENLLKTMNAKNLRLVSTDNLCLEIALGERKKGKLTTDNEFIDIAGTNYESYRDGVQISRNQKLNQCHMYIFRMINEGRSNEYPKVAQIAEEILAAKASQNPKMLQQIMARYAGQSWFTLFEIIDTPLENIKTKSTPSNTGTTLTQ